MEENKLKIAVVGAEGSGKTSIISALFQFAENAEFRPEDWKDYHIKVKGRGFFSDEKTTAIYEHVQKKYEEYSSNLDIPTEIERKMNFDEYAYKMSIFSSKFEITFCDTPRMSESDSYSNRRINNVMKSADVIIVAIDTPSIMEEHQCYERIIRTANDCALRLNNAMNAQQSKLVIFVPVKCEKYYYNETLSQVSSRVRDLYQLFFERYVCIHSAKNKISNKGICGTSRSFAVISPLVTLGGVVFKGYEDKRRLSSQRCHMRGNAEFKVKLAENIFVAIANFLILQNLCKTEVIDEYSDDDRIYAWLMLGAKGIAAMFGVRTPYARVNWDHLLLKGDKREVDVEALLETKYKNGYREFYSEAVLASGKLTSDIKNKG